MQACKPKVIGSTPAAPPHPPPRSPQMTTLLAPWTTHGAEMLHFGPLRVSAAKRTAPPPPIKNKKPNRQGLPPCCAPFWWSKIRAFGYNNMRVTRLTHTHSNMLNKYRVIFRMSEICFYRRSPEIKLRSWGIYVLSRGLFTEKTLIG